MDEKCFACENGKCRALRVHECNNDSEFCAFFKTRKEMAEEARACSERLKRIGMESAAKREYEDYLFYHQFELARKRA